LNHEVASMNAHRFRASSRLLAATCFGAALAHSASAAPLPAQDPCTLIPDSDLRRLLPAAQAGQRDRSSEPEGISRCVWKNANGLVQLKLELLVAREGRRADSGAAGQPKGASQRKLDRLGEGALVFYWPRDPKAGLTHELAGGVARRGKVDVQLQSDELAIQGAEPALRTLEALLESAVKRL
jgi:uncharacterized membrane protein